MVARVHVRFIVHGSACPFVRAMNGRPKMQGIKRATNASVYVRVCVCVCVGECVCVCVCVCAWVGVRVCEGE